MDELKMKNRLDTFMLDFYNDLKEKYKTADEDEEEPFFPKTKKKKKVEIMPAIKRKNRNNSISMIEAFFNSLVGSEVEEQFLLYEEFVNLPWLRDLPHIAWNFFETLWLYSADDQEELELAMLDRENIDINAKLRLDRIKKEFDKSTFEYAWETFKKLARNP